jgi:hypothetical protein
MTGSPVQRIALFGGTGGTGSATVRALMKRKEFQNGTIHIHLMVRSKAKLFRMIPGIQSCSNVHTWEGQLSDEETIKMVLRDADTIICALGENSNIPGCHVLQGLAASIVNVLGGLRSSCTGEWKKPRLIFLSSSTWNDRFAAHEPALALWLLKTAFYHPYLDLRLATSHFAAAPELLSLLLVQPSALVYDEPTGMEISTESVSIAVSYADLGEAFVELATRQSYSQLGAVGVSSKGGNNIKKYWFELLSRVVRGFIEGYVPGYWPIKNRLSQRRAT